MQIISKVTKVKFEKPVTLDWVMSFFEQEKIIPIRWAITSVNNDVLTISYNYIN